MSFSIDKQFKVKRNCLNEFLDDLTKLDQEYFPYPWKAEDWKLLLNDSDHELIVLFDSFNIVGFALWKLSRYEDLAHLLKILIVPKYRAHGLGLSFLNNSVSLLKNDNFVKFYLEVEKENFKAIRVYNNANFKVIHEVNRFYSDGKDAIIMMKQLCD